MTDVNSPVRDGLSRKAVSPLSMISLLAISASMTAAPAQAQDMTTSPAPLQPAPVIAPQPAPTVTQTRADDLASDGGFDAATVAPEALAQIEREQQARNDAAAAAAKSAAAARAAATKSAPAPATSAAVTDSVAQATPVLDADGAADSVAVIPMISPVAESAAPPAAVPADSGTDWSLLAALAAMLGIGSAGAYAATGRRRSKARQTAALDAAIMPELRHNSVKAEIRRKMDAAQPKIQPMVQEAENNMRTKVAFADFVANMPAFEAPLGKTDSGVTNGQRRVAAAPRPYLSDADLSRPAGYFTAHVDAMPTPQNPFLTRQKRLKRARYLDGKLAERKAFSPDSGAKETGPMRVARPLEAALH